MQLPRSFFLAWYTAMLSRVEDAGRSVMKGFDESHLKTDGAGNPLAPVTSADLLSSRILTGSPFNTPMVSEETFKTSQANLTGLITWVDPLDATQEYTEGMPLQPYTEFTTYSGRPLLFRSFDYIRSY